jgi:hypothetical protein
MRHGFLALAVSMIIGTAVSGLATASTPAEKITCTDTPRSSWLPEAKIREIFGAQNFALAKLKVSRGNCYEFYAVDRNGMVVEAYYHPISGDVVRYNRVVTGGAGTEYESSTTSQR